MGAGGAPPRIIVARLLYTNSMTSSTTALEERLLRTYHIRVGSGGARVGRCAIRRRRGERREGPMAPYATTGQCFEALFMTMTRSHRRGTAPKICTYGAQAGRVTSCWPAHAGMLPIGRGWPGKTWERVWRAVAEELGSATSGRWRRICPRPAYQSAGGMQTL